LASEKALAMFRPTRIVVDVVDLRHGVPQFHQRREIGRSDTHFRVSIRTVGWNGRGKRQRWIPVWGHASL
jgi:hypothetical protein